jgi:hypothetical protein
MIKHLAMTADGSAVVASTTEAELVYLSVSHDQPILHRVKDESSTSFINMISLQPDGSFVVFDSGDGVLIRIDSQNDTIVKATFDSRHFLQGSWKQDHKACVLGGSLIFGSKLSSLFALDIEMLLAANVECVTTFGPGREKMGSLEGAQEEYGSRVRYTLAVLSLYTTTTQVTTHRHSRLKYEQSPSFQSHHVRSAVRANSSSRSASPAPSSGICPRG